MKPSTHGPRAAIYARVSSEQQADGGTIASQVAALEECLQREGLTLDPEGRFLDDGYSGSTLIRRWPLSGGRAASARPMGTASSASFSMRRSSGMPVRAKSTPESG